MLAELFVFWSVPFWILCALSTCFLFVCVQFEKIWGATITLVATIAIIGFFNHIDLFPYAKAHPWEMIGMVALYILIGVAWSVYRWYVYLLDRRKEIQKKKYEFLEENKVRGKEVPDALKEKWMFVLYSRSSHVHYRDNTERDLKAVFLNKHPTRRTSDSNDLEIPANLQEEWKKEVARISGDLQEKMRARPRDHKSQITLWMMYWPWSLAWYMMSDPIMRFFHWTYRRIQSLLEKISQHVWKDVEKDLPPTDDI